MRREPNRGKQLDLRAREGCARQDAQTAGVEEGERVEPSVIGTGGQVSIDRMCARLEGGAGEGNNFEDSARA
jgi:hypothetical protein